MSPVASPGELREGQDGAFRFKLSDTATGTPVAGAYPAAWIDFSPTPARRGEAAPSGSSS